MKRFVLLLSALLLCGVCFGGGCAIAEALDITEYHVSDAELYRTDAFTAEGETIHSLDLDWVAGDVSVRAGESLTVSETGNTASTPLCWRIEDGVLYLRFVPNGTKLHQLSKNLDLVFPDALLDVEVNIVSARLTIEGVTIGTAEIDSVSGDICFSEAFVSQAEIDSVSGKIEMLGEEACFNTLKVDTLSGDVRASLHATTASVSISTISGRATLLLRQDAGFVATLQTLSGKLHTSLTDGEGNVARYKDSAIQLSMDSLSGDMNIDKDF